MNEAALGIDASDSEPGAVRPQPPGPDDDSGGGLGIGLPGLLAGVRLTPAQAAQLVADLLAELARVDGGRPIALRDGAVTVSDGGRLTIDVDATGTETDAAAAGVLRDIAMNCRGSGFGDVLTETISDTKDYESLIRRVRPVVDPELDPAGEARRRRQIGDLVRATAGRTPAEAGTVDDRTSTRNAPPVPSGSLVPSAGWYPPVPSAWHLQRRRPSRRQAVFVLLAIVALAGAVAAAPRAWDQLHRGWSALVEPVNRSADNHLEPVSPPPEPTGPAAPGAGGRSPGAVHTGAPASAGQIVSVAASFADGSCSSGQQCAVRVDVRLDPAAPVDAVTWRLDVYDRCSGEVQAGGDVTMPAEPGREGVYGLSKTTLPAGPALAVAAVTSAPAVAASEPLYVPAENAAC